ncbi:ACP S-malonyltransferase [Candidatus Sumerlaeota bacterium]|nr:ACP S-malonyltransferase [Candidatus Sumerlaeota bacterium]
MSSSLAFLFPGQGSQFVGMGLTLFESEPVARRRFEEADEILGFSISKICFEGPEATLKDTVHQQPAMFVCSAAACDVLHERGLRPDCVAGHSLGEYAALYAAGVLDFETGLRLVARRGQVMAEAGRTAPGAMAAVLGMDVRSLEAVCGQACEGDSLVVVANDNSPGQVVISGHRDAVERACDLAKQMGAKRAVLLPVSGAFHSPLVAAARNAMIEHIERADVRPPECDFIANVSAQVENDPGAIRRRLVEQITGRVRWVETVRLMASMGVGRVLEVGPGNVLAGLLGRIDSGIEALPAGSIDDVDCALEEMSRIVLG